MAKRIVDLPPELLESIIVTLSDAPFSISALSKTCSTFFLLIYKGPDHHLWRRLFLSRYDDPRQTDHLNRHPFDKTLWRDEYTSRAATEEHLTHGVDKWLGIPQGQFASTFDSLARSCCTAPPLPLQLREAPAQPDRSSQSSTGLLQVYKKTHDIVQCVPKDIAPSFNIERLNALAKEGYFQFLLQWLSKPYRKLVEEQTQVGCKLIAYLGFRRTVGRGMLPQSFSDPLYEKPLIDAAKRTYNMDYPVQERMYGPYIKHRRGKYTPDWLQLASVRLLCEAALLDHNHDLLNELTELDRLRPGAWTVGLGTPSQSEAGGSSEMAPNKDWAGVEGVWRSVRSLSYLHCS